MEMKRFTLVELLVSIAVIALLASLLLPALGNARESSKRMACLNTLKQMALSNEMYADDFSDYYVPIRMKDPVTALVTGWSTNPAFLSGMGWRGPEPPPGSCYVPLRHLCPKASLAAKSLWWWAGTPFYRNFSHGYSTRPFAATYATLNYAGWRRSQVASPSSKILVLDMVDAVGDGTGADPALYRSHPEYYGIGYWGIVAYRHPGNVSNVLFFDGHATGVTAGSLFSSDLYPSAWLTTQP